MINGSTATKINEFMVICVVVLMDDNTLILQRYQLLAGRYALRVAESRKAFFLFEILFSKSACRIFGNSTYLNGKFQWLPLLGLPII